MASASRYLSTEDASSEIIMYDIKLNTRLLSNNYNIRRIFSLIVRSKRRGRERERRAYFTGYLCCGKLANVLVCLNNDLCMK